MTDIKDVLLQWFITFFDKKSATCADKSAAATPAEQETLGCKLTWCVINK